MIKLNLKQALRSKGIDNANKFLIDCGIPYYTASKLLNNHVGSIPFKYLEKICLNLHCTIDDLCIWIPDNKTPVSANHPLFKLSGNDTTETITQKIIQLPFDKIRQINQYIDQMDNLK